MCIIGLYTCLVIVRPLNYIPYPLIVSIPANRKVSPPPLKKKKKKPKRVCAKGQKNQHRSKCVHPAFWLLFFILFLFYTFSFLLSIFYPSPIKLGNVYNLVKKKREKNHKKKNKKKQQVSSELLSRINIVMMLQLFPCVFCVFCVPLVSPCGAGYLIH